MKVRGLNLYTRPVQIISLTLPLPYEGRGDPAHPGATLVQLR